MAYLVLTKDSVTATVDAVVYFKIFESVVSVINVEDVSKSTRLLAATTLRKVLGTYSLQEILADRESVANELQSSLDEATISWGVKVILINKYRHSIKGLNFYK